MLEVAPMSADKARLVARAAARMEQQKRLARRDFTEFVRMAGADEAGNPFKLEPIHMYWHRHVAWCWRNGLHAGVLAHWGSGKSSGLVVPLPAWLIGVNPNIRIKIVCNGTENARERVASVKQMMMSPAYHEVFPRMRPGGSWATDQITVQRTGRSSDPSLQAKGVFGLGVGKRADVIIFDDVVDQKNSIEALQRKRVRETTSQTWMSRLVPGGRALWIATPWNTDDATYHIMKQRGWCFLIQEVAEDCSILHQRVIGAHPGYPVH